MFSFARRWFWFCLLFPLRPIHMILPPSTCKQSHQKQLCEQRKNNYKHKHYITFFHSLSPHSQTHWNLQNWWKVFDSLQAFEETFALKLLGLALTCEAVFAFCTRTQTHPLFIHITDSLSHVCHYWSPIVAERYRHTRNHHTRKQHYKYVMHFDTCFYLKLL